MNQKERYHKLKSSGMCVTCGTRKATSGLRCQHCIDYMKKWSAIRREKLTKSGLCTCGNQPPTGMKTCDDCNERAKSRFRKRKQMGLCQCGGSASEGHVLCESCLAKRRNNNTRLKTEVFDHYGGCSCACCGETIMKFLTIDHINNDGAKHRREIGKLSVYGWLRDNNYPDGFQVLCFNCNHGRHLNGGVCPHKET